MHDTYVYDQLITLAILVSLGLFIGFSFDVLSVFRQFIRLSRPLQFFIDFIFCLCMTVFVFIVLVVNNWGEVRAYVFLCIVFGVILYQLLFHRFCRRIMVKAADLLVAFFHFIARPFIWFFCKVSMLIRFFQRFFSGNLTAGKQMAKKIRLKFRRKKKE